MAVEVTYGCALTTVETLEVNVPAATEPNRVVTHDQFNTPSEQIDATDVAYFEQALTAGSATIDLTAAPHVNGLEVDGSDLKVKAMRFRAKSDNAGPMTIESGASNGFGAFEFVLAPGAEITIKGNDTTVEVDKYTIDLSGTGTDKVEVTLIFGE